MIHRMIILLLCVSFVNATEKTYHPQLGDIVFQSLPNPWGKDLVDMIEGATDSPYSHCGMVIIEDGKWQVIEAIGPVQIVPLDVWQARGRGRKIWAYRPAEKFRNSIPIMVKVMKKDLGKPYDIRYRLDSENIYCSELLYRGWKEVTGKPLGRLVKLHELNWQPYRKIIVAIEGSEEIPLDREIITPSDLAQASELTQVWPIPETHQQGMKKKSQK